MLRVIFDTNIYGKLLEENNFEEIALQIKQDKELKIYGFHPIRKELRDTPKRIRMGKFNKRNMLLGFYDELTGGRYLKDSIQLHSLALKFYTAYRNFGGIVNKDKSNIEVDFTIVACATFYKLDLVISDDQKTLLSKPALKAYKHICIKDGLWQPNFWKYSELRIRYRF